ncbi:MAG: sodium:proton exchanger [Epsilonproteobacteria bacterium]|nr:sodium:proton exchanger [Campylobacterota bacterium]
MHENLTLLGIALVILGYGYFSRRLERLNISGPMVFTAVGILLSPLAFGNRPVHLESGAVRTLAEVALIIILFADAAGVSLHRLKQWSRLPLRLLFAALPLTILITAGAGTYFFPEESVLYLLLLALILAPTDAALGKAVVTDPRIPARIRDTVNVESGLNDGIVFPLFVTVLGVIAEGGEGQGWFGYVIKQILFGGLWGAAAGYTGAKLANLSRKHDWADGHYFDLIPVALAIFSYYLAEAFGGNGFIAAYFAGLFAGNYSQVLKRHIAAFAHSEGELLSMIIFLVFGLVIIPEAVGAWDYRVLLFSLLSLTLFRMAPAALSLIGTKTSWQETLFLGWFGPRGVASVLYLLIAAESLKTLHSHAALFATVALTVLLSIFAHGLSARPLADRLGQKPK